MDDTGTSLEGAALATSSDSLQSDLLDDKASQSDSLFVSRSESISSSVSTFYNAGESTSSSYLATTVTTNAGTGTGSASAAKPFGTKDDFSNYLINGYWADKGTIGHSWANPTGLTYSFSAGYSASQENGIRAAFQQWENVTNVQFTEVGSGGDIDLRVGPVGDGAYTSAVWTGGGTTTSAYISIDTSQWYWSNFDTMGDYAKISIIHEIGHALGLGHTGNYNGSASYATDATYSNDTRQYSIMSYFDADKSGADYNSGGWQYNSTPALYDIYAIQQIYGANNTIRAGDTTYGFNSTAGDNALDFTINTAPVVAIWDGGGNDTLDLSGYSATQTINLGEGTFSDIGGMIGNLAIAYGATIENATGGSGADTIYGNAADNIILGGGGNDILFGSIGSDTLDGQAGTDTANYNFATADFTFNFIDSVTVDLSDTLGGWLDTVTNVENFIFTDGTYTFAQLQTNFGANDFAPVVTVNDATLDVNAYVNANSILSATDADGNTLTYEVWDSGRAGAYFDLDGAKLSSQAGHTLTQAEFDSLRIVGGNFDNSDAMWLRVSDGVHTTAWERFDISTVSGSGGGAYDLAPVVTLTDLTLTQQQVVLASTAINAADPEGADLTYVVWDGGTNSSSGYFELNGARLSAGTAHTLTQAEFNALNIVGADFNTNETLWVYTSDGRYQTQWQSFTLTTSGGLPGANHAPTVTANNLTLDGQESVLASASITSNDADGDPLTYEVWDGNKATGSGYFTLNGNQLAAGFGHTLTQAQFDTLHIVGGADSTIDNMWVRVSDGYVTTNWEAFTLTSSGTLFAGANIAPTVTANDLTLNMNQTTLASATISANDANGDTLTYEVWDGAGGSTTGYFDLNGTKLSAGSGHVLTQAEFDSLQIVGGSDNASETMWVRVSDGTVTTNWDAFTLTTTAPVNTAPTVTATSLTVSSGNSVLASTVISANDANGDPLTYYVWDGDGSSTSGYFDLNGTQLAAGTSNTLTQAEFDALQIVGGTNNGTEKLWVQVSDGIDTTLWHEFDLQTINGVAQTAPDPNLSYSNLIDPGSPNDFAAALTDLSGSSTSTTTTGTATAPTDSNVFTSVAPDDLNQTPPPVV